MKNILLLLFSLMIVLFSCESSTKKQHRLHREQLYKDSIEAVKIKTDSIEKAIIDSLAMIAWGDAKFGMSVEETLKTEVFKNGHKAKGLHKWMTSITADKKEITNTKTWLFDFDAWFEVDELCSIQIKSYELDASYLNRIKKDISVIERGFTNKYGEPSTTLGDFDIFNFTNEELFIYAKWSIGSKSIFIQLGENDNKYYYQIIISNHDYPTHDDPEKIKYYDIGRDEKEQKEKLEF